MAKRRRLSPNQLAEIKSNFAGLKQIEDYLPQKDELKVTAIQAVETALESMITEEAQLETRLSALRHEIAEKGYEFSLKMTNAAQQVIAQFGDDSAELQSLGRVRKSARASNRRRKDGSDSNGS